jgi:hypothetical protein
MEQPERRHDASGGDEVDGLDVRPPEVLEAREVQREVAEHGAEGPEHGRDQRQDLEPLRRLAEQVVEVAAGPPPSA